MKTQYTEAKVGDRVVVFNNINTSPKMTGFVIATSEHFVEINVEPIHYLEVWRRKEWVSKANIEIIKG